MPNRRKDGIFFSAFPNRVTILAGHFGSGKTEIAINAALSLARGDAPVSLVDLDVVKPYFRSRSATQFLAEAGVELVAPGGEFFSADLPIILPEIRSRVREESRKVVVDAGGDDTGARVIGSLTDVLSPEDSDLLLVLNFRRPFTPDVPSAVAMVREIEVTARMPVTGIISNTHLMDDTTLDTVREGYRMAVETARRIDVRVAAVAVEEKLWEAGEAESYPCPVILLRRIVRPPFKGAKQEQVVGPIFVVG